MRHRSSRQSVFLGCLLSAAFLLGCASAPVQEMSDARQAVRAAQDAGAATKAPQTFAQAQDALSRAESLLNKRFYNSARKSAEEAHSKGIAALEQSRAAQVQQK